MSNLPDSRTAIVTGAASQRGIGRRVAERLAGLGWNLAIIDLDGGAAADTASALAERFGVCAAGWGADVTDQAAVVKAIDDAEKSLPPIVGLANLAGISSPTPYLDLTLEEWRRQIDVNLTGVHIVTQRAARSMVSHGVGRIVSISSISAQRGGGTFSKTPYSAAKSGLIGFTRSIARELGHFGITANTISPGPIDTDIMGGQLTEERKQSFISEQIIKRVGTPTDVAEATSFLMSDGAGFITGQNLNVNGGQYMS
ncbi:SDR family oxidoreductase [Microbacterium sp. zg.B48]|uniref:SDR family NAD(P)-dependent oxidoreductase n=1 Tax=Microbacterium sp. zg.B48 TaxID=2969408 RepID=UPI00214B7031|nr:SDR family NAD(P)-dependent oxidoreductase [Microbacterium sp. zg.B48]MCR2762826.1 SDR family oxidoreductase [Microbacterium sp. zg.B48]